jgi:hypothetical protein
LGICDERKRELHTNLLSDFTDWGCSRYSSERNSDRRNGHEHEAITLAHLLKAYILVETHQAIRAGFKLKCMAAYVVAKLTCDDHCLGC